jgi:spore coat protein U-like protein
MRRASLRILGWALALVFPAFASAECLISAGSVSFGAYDSLSLLDTDTAGSVSVSCDGDTVGQLSLTAGLGSFSARRMQNGAHALLYNLYVDPTRLSIWGDGSPGTSLVSIGGTGGTYTVYARIPARQNVPAGGYSDTITVTLIF